MLITRLIHHVDSGLPLDDFQVTLLEALILMKTAWGKVTPLTVQHSFRHAGFAFLGHKEESSETADAKETEPVLAEPLLTRLCREWNISPDDYIDVDNDVVTCAASSTEEILAFAAPTSDFPAHDVDSDNDDCGEQELSVSTTSALAAVSKLELYLMQTGCCDDLSTSFRNFREHFERFVHMRTSFQTKMTTFFPVDLSRKHTAKGSQKPSATQTSASNTELTTQFLTHQEPSSSPTNFMGSSTCTGHLSPPPATLEVTSVSAGATSFPSTDSGLPLSLSICSDPPSSPSHSRGPPSPHLPSTRPSSTKVRPLKHSSSNPGFYSLSQFGKHSDRCRLFHDLAIKLASVKTYKELEELVAQNEHALLKYPLSCQVKPFNKDYMKVDSNSLKLYPDDVPQLLPVSIYGDGNCLARCGSILAFQDEDFHEEIRVRIVFEMVKHAQIYLSDDFLAQGTDFKDLVKVYVSYADQPIPLNITVEGMEEVFRKEAMYTRLNGTYMGMWELHALSSVLSTPLRSVYPAYGGFNVRKHLNRIVYPRENEGLSDAKDLPTIMWTSTSGRKASPKAWGPNHFVVCVPYE